MSTVTLGISFTRPSPKSRLRKKQHVDGNILWRHHGISDSLESMRLYSLSLPLFVVSVWLAHPFVPALADGRAVEQNNQPTTRQNDPRLPPVLPGEEIVTESGQRMRVWSSAGPVPVNQRPTPQVLQGNGYGGPSVIVDGRFDNRDGRPPRDGDPIANPPLRQPRGGEDDFQLSQPRYPKSSQHIDVE